jgi:hypothetical protein
MSDPIFDNFSKIQWHYAHKDPSALAELERRVAAAATKRGLLTYSDLVRDVEFNLPTLKVPKRVIDTSDWQDVDRAIIGDFLGYMSMRSYESAGFFSSALVVSKMDGSPSEGFYTLLRELGLISSGKTDKAMYLWADHVAKAHTWYARHPDSAT